MGRGGAIYLTYIALALLAGASSARAEIKGLWKVDIDESPAPPPEKGPPLSAHASRDRSVLAYEIVGIVAAYLVFVLLLGTMLLTVGRRLRRQAQEMAHRPREMTSLHVDKGGVNIKVIEPAFDDAHYKVHEQHERQNLDQLGDIYSSVFKMEDQGTRASHHKSALSVSSNKTTGSPKSYRKPGLLNLQYQDNADGALEPLSPGYGPPTSDTYASQYPAATTPRSFVSLAGREHHEYEEDRYDDGVQYPYSQHSYPAQPPRQTLVPSGNRSSGQNTATGGLPFRERFATQEPPKSPGTAIIDSYRENDEATPETPQIVNRWIEVPEDDRFDGALPTAKYGDITRPQPTPTMSRDAFPTRKELKQRQREDRGAMMEEDAVVEDMWKSPY